MKDVDSCQNSENMEMKYCRKSEFQYIKPNYVKEGRIWEVEQGFYSPNDSSKYHTTIRNFQKQTRKTPESKENNEVGVHGSDKGRH